MSSFNSAVMRDPFRRRFSEAQCCFDAEELHAQMAEVDVISFDFFDTLFIRPLCEPEDLFDLLGQQFSIKNFRQIRQEAQAEAFRRMIQAGRKEITLAEIYECFQPQSVPNRLLLQAEYELELALVQLNPELVASYNYALESKKTVIIVSDMYLPKSYFEAALRAQCYEPPLLFISADRNATKRDHGELFDHVVKELNVVPERILHIGDNQQSDIQQARKKGLHAFYYRDARRPQPLQGAPVAASIAHGLIRTTGRSFPKDSFEELGFLFGGPASVGFAAWLAEQAKADAVDHILFLARDGYGLTQIINHAVGDTLPPVHYFLGSRVAFWLAAMTEENFHQFLPDLLSGAIGLSPYELLERIGVPAPAPEVMAAVSLSDDSVITVDCMDRLCRFFYAWRGPILQVCRRNRQALFAYLGALGIRSGSRVALVDVGWNGTTQEAFEKAVRPMLALDVHGYYFCLADTANRIRRQASMQMKAMFSSATESVELVAQLYADRVAVELFFSAPHGTVIGWQLVEDQIVPVEDWGRAPVGQMQEAIAAIVSGTKAFAQSYGQQKKRLGLTVEPRDEAWPLINLVTTKKWKNSLLFSKLINFDAWGSSRNRDIVLHDYHAW
ncbi:MAG: HAD family hydrolase [Desulfuromonas sp.]|nr:hypothetical protein [Desulfuromonas thiophila]